MRQNSTRQAVVATLILFMASNSAIYAGSKSSAKQDPADVEEEAAVNPRENYGCGLFSGIYAALGFLQGNMGVFTHLDADWKQVIKSRKAVAKELSITIKNMAADEPDLSLKENLEKLAGWFTEYYPEDGQDWGQKADDQARHFDTVRLRTFSLKKEYCSEASAQDD
ncbi:MAG: hypothetical protein HY747_00885 [Elusimicrobia bacterium]|nr:hypothetical protein [Elusimicrobiota bacterium]